MKKNKLEIKHFGVIKEWFKNGQFYRDDGHVIEYYDGEKRWHKNGELHREDDFAVLN